MHLSSVAQSHLCHYSLCIVSCHLACYLTCLTCSWKDTWTCSIRELKQISAHSKSWKESNLSTERPQVTFKMKARANLPFHLQSLSGLPSLPPVPARTAMMGKRFSWLLLEQQSPKMFLAAKSPNHREMFSLLTEKWELKERRHTSACLLTYSVFLGGEACTELPTGEWWRWSQNQLQTSLQSPYEGCYSWNRSLQPPYPVESKQVGDLSWGSCWMTGPLFQRNAEKCYTHFCWPRGSMGE